jgi:outer membrane protein assembly factor BamB
MTSIVFIVGCSSPAPVPFPSPTFTSSPTPKPLPPNTPTPSPTQLVAPTATPTIAPSPIRTATPPARTQTGWVAQQGGPDNARANLSAKLVPPLKLAWEWKEGNNSPQTVAIANDLVFILTTQGQFCVLDAKTGSRKICQPIWDQIKGSTSGQIALSGDTAMVSALEIYIKPGDRYGSARSRLVAFSLDGQPRWALPPIEDQVSQAIAFGNGIVVFDSRTGQNESLTALDIGSGTQRWKIPGSFNHGASDGTSLYAGNGNVLALRLNTGERIWGQSIDAKHVLCAQGRVFAVGDNAITGLDVVTGKSIWKTTFGVFPLTSDQVGIAAAHDHLYVLPTPGQTHLGYGSGVMTLEAATGKEIWSAITGPDLRANHIAATVDALVVLGTEWDGTTFAKKLWVLNPANGAILDRVDVSTDDLDTMNNLAVADDKVYVLGQTLRVYGPIR